MAIHQQRPSERRRWMNADRVLLLGILVMQTLILICYLAFNLTHRTVSGDAAAAYSQTNTETNLTTAASLSSHLSTPAVRPLDRDPSWHPSPSLLPMPAPHSRLHGDLHERMNDMFEQAMTEFQQMDRFIRTLDDGWGSLSMSPALDMREQDDSYVVVCSLPDLDAADITVTLEGRLLTIQGDSRTRVRHPSHIAHFERRVLLPGPVDREHQAWASLTNGLLKVVVPKTAEMAHESRPHRLL